LACCIWGGCLGYDLTKIEEEFREEGLARYNCMLDFCSPMNMHQEPALKGNNSSIYHASNTIHTRCIEINQLEDRHPLNYNLQYRQACNHDGYKTHYHLNRANYFNLKVCWFVQAYVPSILVTNRKTNKFLKLKKLDQLIAAELDVPKNHALMDEREALFLDYLATNKNFNQTDFLHYRFWSFDLDLDTPIALNDLTGCLSILGLMPYVCTIVRTSLTGYHIFMKSEMIASRDHVENWPIALSDKELLKITPEYIQQLKESSPKKTGYSWTGVTRRGIPSKLRLATIPIPIPEDAKLFKGGYYGDNKCYEDFDTAYHEIAGVLGTDPSMFAPTAVAQLPGYTNPKNGFTAHTIYANGAAPVLTLRIYKGQIKPRIDKWYDDYSLPFYVPSKRTTTYKINNEDEVLRPFYGSPKIILDPSSERFVRPVQPQAVVEIQSTLEQELLPVIEDKTKSELKEKIAPVKQKKEYRPIYSGRRAIPSSPEEYCFIHNLTDECMWGDDINGHSNDMLKLFCRFSHLYINLKDRKELKAYFDAILKPYFTTRKSQLVLKNTTTLYRHYLSMCKHNAKTSKSSRGTKVSDGLKGIYTSSSDLLSDWEDQLKSKLGENHKILTNEVHKKLRSLLCDHVLSCGSVIKENGVLKFEFQISAEYLNHYISRYNEKLKFYAEIGFFTRGKKYVMPKKKNGVVVQKGECKKGYLIIQDKSSLISSSESIELVKQVPEVIMDISETLDPVVTPTAANVIVLEKIPTSDDIERYTTEEKTEFVFGILPYLIAKEKYPTYETLESFVKNRFKEDKLPHVKIAEDFMVNHTLDLYINNAIPLKKVKLPFSIQKNFVSEDFVAEVLPSVAEVSKYDEIQKKDFVYNHLIDWLPEKSTMRQSLYLLYNTDNVEWEAALVGSMFNSYCNGSLDILKQPKKDPNRKAKVFVKKEAPFDPNRIQFDVDLTAPDDELAKQYVEQWEVHKRRCKIEINKTRNHDPVLRIELDNRKDSFEKIIHTVNDIIDEKEKLYSQFVGMTEDLHDGYLWAHPGCLNRDNMMTGYNEKLKTIDPELFEFYEKPLQLFIEETDYTSVIEEYVFRIVFLRNTVPLPLDYDEDFSYLKNCKSKIKYVRSLLALL
jgi:hypothetical protein